jgi:hypothetical protein
MRSVFSSFRLSLVAVGLVFSAVLAVSGQNREKFGISAKAGGVNAISGRAEMRSSPSADWQLLNVTDDLRAGDDVRTGRDGLVEMLLNPGAYLRVAENSEFHLTNTTLEALEIKLASGTAIIEATGSDDTELAINITTPHARMVIVKRGLYRVNVLPGNATELIVRKGRVLLADTHTRIKSGNKVIFNSTTFSVAKLEGADKKKDSFEGWSKERAGTLTQANQRLEARSVNSFLSGRNGWSDEFSARANGVWFYNARYRCFTFLPFLFGWGSPYGSNYSSTLLFGGYGCCGGWNGWNRGRVVNNAPSQGPTSPSATGSGSSGSGSGPISAPRISPPTQPPPSRNPGSDRPMRSPAADPGRTVAPRRSIGQR